MVAVAYVILNFELLYRPSASEVCLLFFLPLGKSDALSIFYIKLTIRVSWQSPVDMEGDSSKVNDFRDAAVATHPQRPIEVKSTDRDTRALARHGKRQQLNVYL